MTVHNLDIITNDASFANALSDVEPHHDFSGDQSVPDSVLWINKKQEIKSCLDDVKFGLCQGQIEFYNVSYLHLKTLTIYSHE